MKPDPYASPLYRVVLGALKDTINQHGPIDKNLIGSAAKRVVAQIEAANQEREV
jgi:hypothetical protein